VWLKPHDKPISLSWALALGIFMDEP
jgi:hypothetical protein